MKIILGSQSAGRRSVLSQAGVRFSVVPARINEKSIRHDDYLQLPLLIARAKAEALITKLTGSALLITADTVVIYRGKLREKPESPEQARAYLSSYKPNEPAWVNTAIVVTNLQTGKCFEGIDKAAVFFESIPSEIIEQAIAEGYIFGCAGAFAVETHLLKPFVKKIEGEVSAVVGLPLKLTLRLLAKARA